MTVAEARKLLASDLDVFWRAYCTLAVTLGLRPGELTGLMWEDVDPEAGVIRVRHSLKRTPDALQALDLKTEASRRTLRDAGQLARLGRAARAARPAGGRPARTR
jgi:integrase